MPRLQRHEVIVRIESLDDLRDKLQGNIVLSTDAVQKAELTRQYHVIGELRQSLYQILDLLEA